jgi:hypothetical protein
MRWPDLAADLRAGLRHRVKVFGVGVRFCDEAVQVEPVDQLACIDRIDVGNELEQDVQQPLRRRRWIGSGRLGLKAECDEWVTHYDVGSTIKFTNGRLCPINRSACRSLNRISSGLAESSTARTWSARP